MAGGQAGLDPMLSTLAADQASFTAHPVGDLGVCHAAADQAPEFRRVIGSPRTSVCQGALHIRRAGKIA